MWFMSFLALLVSISNGPAETWVSQMNPVVQQGLPNRSALEFHRSTAPLCLGL
jgi:hypothetical protein